MSLGYPAMWNYATRRFECPHCTCHAVPDWQGEAPLRCTGCKSPLTHYQVREDPDRQDPAGDYPERGFGTMG